MAFEDIFVDMHPVVLKTKIKSISIQSNTSAVGM
jgi:hypothetical protein